jgi:hypothetical protein
MQRELTPFETGEMFADGVQFVNVRPGTQEEICSLLFFLRGKFLPQV